MIRHHVRRPITTNFIKTLAIIGSLVFILAAIPSAQSASASTTSSIKSNGAKTALLSSPLEPPAAGMILWLDAKDPDGDGNSANNPADGAALTTWVDKSGSGNNATVLAGETAGTFRSAAGELINGAPVVRFTRTSQSEGSVYEIPGVDVRAATHEDVTIITVYRPKSISPLFTGLWGIDDGGWDRFFLTYHSDYGDGLASLGPVQGGVIVPNAGTVGVVRLMTAVYNGAVTGGVNSGPTNGSLIAFDGKTVVRFTDSTDATNAQTHLFMGWSGDSGPFDGDIAEMIVYDRALSSCEIQEANLYLGDKYGRDFNTPAPGGVNDPTTCNLGLWLKSDAGVFSDAGTTLATDGANVLQWNDQSNSGNIVTEAGIASTTNITYTDGVANFNPTVQFDGTSNQSLSGTAAAAFGNDGTIIAVVRADGTQVNVSGILGTTPTAGGQGMYVNPTGQYVIDGTGAVPGNSANTVSAPDQFHVLTGEYTTNSTSNSSIYLDSVLAEHYTGGGVTVDNTDTGFEIGGRTAGGQPLQIFRGRIAEVAYYSNALTDADRLQVESYLAIKYGLTLGDTTTPVSYVNSAGAVVWTGVSGYQNRIIGIGRDDASALNQKQSTNGVLSIGLGAFAATNSANNSSFADDKDFLLVGDDDGALSASADVPASYHQRLTRLWKAQATGTPGPVSLSFDLTGVSGVDLSNDAGFAVLVGNTATLNAATPVTGAVVTGNKVTFSNVALTAGKFFSLAYPMIAHASPVITAPAASAVLASKRPEITGTAVPSSTLTIKDAGGHVICTTIVAADGRWSCTPSSDLPSGNQTISVTATDAFGNISLPATRSLIILPAAPTIGPLGSNGYTIRPAFTGVTDPNITVTVTIDPDNNPATANNIVYDTKSDATGVWMLDTAIATPVSGALPANGLPSPTHIGVSAVAHGANGTLSTPTQQVIVIGFSRYFPLIQ